MLSDESRILSGRKSCFKSSRANGEASQNRYNIDLYTDAIAGHCRQQIILNTSTHYWAYVYTQKWGSIGNHCLNKKYRHHWTTATFVTDPVMGDETGRQADVRGIKLSDQHWRAAWVYHDATNHPLRNDRRGPCKKERFCWADQLYVARTSVCLVFLACKAMSSRHNLYCTFLSLIQRTETATLKSSRPLNIFSIL